MAQQVHQHFAVEFAVCCRPVVPNRHSACVKLVECRQVKGGPTRLLLRQERLCQEECVQVAGVAQVWVAKVLGMPAQDGQIKLCRVQGARAWVGFGSES